MELSKLAKENQQTIDELRKQLNSESAECKFVKSLFMENKADMDKNLTNEKIIQQELTDTIKKHEQNLSSQEKKELQLNKKLESSENEIEKLKKVS